MVCQVSLRWAATRGGSFKCFSLFNLFLSLFFCWSRLNSDSWPSRLERSCSTWGDQKRREKIHEFVAKQKKLHRNWIIDKMQDFFGVFILSGNERPSKKQWTRSKHSSLLSVSCCFSPSCCFSFRAKSNGRRKSTECAKNCINQKEKEKQSQQASSHKTIMHHFPLFVSEMVARYLSEAH